jgi:hypothetical protein
MRRTGKKATRRRVRVGDLLEDLGGKCLAALALDVLD